MGKLKQVARLATACLGLATASVQARPVLYGDDPVSITLEQGVAAYFRFPLEVKLVTRAERFQVGPANSAQPDYALLSVTPRFSSGTSSVSFFLSDGSIVRTRLTQSGAGRGSDAEGVFDFKPRERGGGGADGGEGSGRALLELDLLRAMIRGDEAPGFESRLVNREVRPGFRGLTTRLVGIYSGDRFKGYIFELVNTQRKSLYINIQNLMLGDPNTAIVSSVDSAVLAPKGEVGASTYLRVVARSTTSPPQLVLPVQIVEKPVKK
ncbi:MAG: hypothetical protein JST16_05265 [Bdellovibrionales bacterium]|nr:hypothetical protein [Bdellovibrionales bacterium]